MEVITEKHRKERLIHKIHAGAIDGDTMSATKSNGHIGINKTIRAVCSRFYWPDMSREVRNFIDTCRKCQMKKDIAIQKTSTLMHPVPIPIKVMSQVGI